MGQHQIEVINQARKKLPLAATLEHFLQRLCHASPVLEKENGKDWDQYQPNPVRQKCSCPRSQASCPSEDLLSVARQKVFDSQLGVVAPPSFCPDLPSDLAGCNFVYQPGNVRAKSTSLVDDMWTDEQQHGRNDDP